MKIVSIVGARPQFIKIAPFVHLIKKHNKLNSKLKIRHLIIHTGQHYDYDLNKIFFDELGIPEPDCKLDVGSGSHGWQTGEMIIRLEKVLVKERPNWVLVYGDTNSTLAGALASTKLHIPIAHIESGLRSYNKKMPEEINRVLTDRCSDILFCPSDNAIKNLRKEGFTNIINNGKLINCSSFTSKNKNIRLPLVVNVGDIMYDAMLICLEIAEKKSAILEKLKVHPKEYFLVTIHRAENTDNKDNLKNIIEALKEISKRNPVIFPIHPRTKKVLKNFNLSLSDCKQIDLIDPVSYFDMLVLEKNAKKILTDSGGMQKEAYLFNVPCITLRNETEWGETVENGKNVLVEANKNRILNATLNSSLITNKPSQFLYGDGQAVEKILNCLCACVRTLY